MFRALEGDALLCLAHVISGVPPLPRPEDLFFPVGKGEIGLRDSAELFQVAVLFCCCSLVPAPLGRIHSPHIFSRQMLWPLCDFWDLFVVLRPLVILWLMRWIL